MIEDVKQAPEDAVNHPSPATLWRPSPTRRGWSSLGFDVGDVVGPVTDIPVLIAGTLGPIPIA